MSDLTKDQNDDPMKKARIRSQINENLRRVYQETLDQDIPDRFQDLLAQLRAKERGTVEGDK